LNVTEDEFKSYLKELLGYDGFILSLVPSRRDAIATVTLTNGEPATLSQCSSRARINLPYPRAGVHLTADCDFFGITPVYSTEEPVVE